MVLSIVAACFCLTQIVISGIGVSELSYSYPNRYDNDIGWYHHDEDTYTTNVVIAMYCIQIMAGLLEAAISITSSAIACKAVCCKSKKVNRIYYPAAGLDNANGNNLASMGQAPAGYITMPISANIITSVPMTEFGIKQSNVDGDSLSSTETPLLNYQNNNMAFQEDSVPNNMNYHGLP